MSDRRTIGPTLTEAEKAKARAATGSETNAVELQAEELEQRIAPVRFS